MITKTYNSNRTAGLTSQAAVEAIGNRYDLVLVGARRARELSRGDTPKVQSGHSHVVTAMLEIESKKIGIDYLLREQNLDTRHHRRSRSTF